MATKAQTLEIEETKIKEFRNKLDELCKEYEVQAVCIGTRKQTATFDDAPSQSGCAAFVGATLENPSIQEARALSKAYDEAEAIFSEIQLKALFKNAIKEAKEEADGEPCECEDCTAQEAAARKINDDPKDAE